MYSFRHNKDKVATTLEQLELYETFVTLETATAALLSGSSVDLANLFAGDLATIQSTYSLFVSKWQARSVNGEGGLDSFGTCVFSGSQILNSFLKLAPKRAEKERKSIGKCTGLNAIELLRSLSIAVGRFIDVVIADIANAEHIKHMLLFSLLLSYSPFLYLQTLETGELSQLLLDIAQVHFPFLSFSFFVITKIFSLSFFSFFLFFLFIKTLKGSSVERTHIAVISSLSLCKGTVRD